MLSPASMFLRRAGPRFARAMVSAAANAVARRNKKQQPRASTAVIVAAPPAPRKKKRQALKGPRTQNRALAVSSTFSAANSDPVHVIRGKQIVDTISSDAGGMLRFTTSPGSYDNDYALLLHPYAFFGTWVQSLSALYQKWRIRDLRVRYVPTCPTTTTGSLVLGLSSDPGSVTAAGAYNAQTISSLPNNSVSQVYTPTTLQPVRNSDWYYTRIPAGLSDTDLKIYSPGALVLDNATSGNTPSLVMGQLIVEYTLEFCGQAAAALA